MTHKDKQDVIAICNILADKMSDSGKVAVQQIIDAVKDMPEPKYFMFGCPKCGYVKISENEEVDE